MFNINVLFDHEVFPKVENIVEQKVEELEQDVSFVKVDTEVVIIVLDENKEVLIKNDKLEDLGDQNFHYFRDFLKVID